jgi:putative transcription antitermination factor YqgF
MLITNNPPKTLAIDYGTKRIGLAISQAALAEPLQVIEYRDQTQAIATIVKICSQFGVEQLVVGLSEQAMAIKTRQFGMLLQQATQLPLAYVDESLSSLEVRQKMKARGKSLHGKPIDHFAAALILDEWFLLCDHNFIHSNA